MVGQVGPRGENVTGQVVVVCKKGSSVLLLTISVKENTVDMKHRTVEVSIKNIYIYRNPNYILLLFKL